MELLWNLLSRGRGPRCSLQSPKPDPAAPFLFLIEDFVSVHLLKALRKATAIPRVCCGERCLLIPLISTEKPFNKFSCFWSQNLKYVLRDLGKSAWTELFEVLLAAWGQWGAFTFRNGFLVSGKNPKRVTPRERPLVRVSSCWASSAGFTLPSPQVGCGFGSLHVVSR